MEHTEHKNSAQLYSQIAASTPAAPMTQPNSTATVAAGPMATPPPMASTPERTTSKEQKSKHPKPQQQKPQAQPRKSEHTPKAPQQRRATVGSIETGLTKKGPASPQARNAKTPSSPHKSQSGPKPCASRSVTETRTFDQIQAEHLYLFSNLQQQEARIRTLVAALATVQSQLQLPVTTAEARRLRKNAGFIKSKLSDAEQQERLALLGIGRVSAELQSRYRHLHLHLHLHHQQQHIAQFYDRGDANDNVQMQPETPYLEPQHGPAHHHQESYETHTSISPNAWQEKRSGVEAEFMSPMSPLAPVFQPGASGFFDNIGNIRNNEHTAATDQVVVESGEGDAHDAAGEDVTKQESLGGSTFAGEAEPDDKGDSDFTPRSVPDEDASAKHGLKSDVGAAGMHYVFNAHGNGNGTSAGDGESDGSDEFMPREMRMRRGSHDGKQPQQTLSSVRNKRMSLPPVRFSWPEKEE